MSNEVLTTSGIFKDLQLSGIQTDSVNVLGLGVGAACVRRSSGASFASSFSGPSTRQHWSILGWTLRAYISWSWGINDRTNGPAPYGRHGDIWAGLLIDSPDTVDPDKAIVPINLTTWTKVWNGETDAIRTLPIPAGQQPTLVAENFMFPVPVVAREASKLQMALVLTPSIWGVSSDNVPDGSFNFFIQDVAYTILYTVEKGY